MRIIGKISMIFAGVLIIAHTIIPHQHKIQLEVAIHKCLFSDWEGRDLENIGILKTLEETIKHVNLGENHLENFRLSSYEYKLSPITIFEVPEILSLLKFQLQNQNKLKHTFCYTTAYTSTQNKISYGLRAPPYSI